MSVLVIRHSLSEANNRHNYGKPAFGHPDAPLMPEGRDIARKMGVEIESIYNVLPSVTPVAVSKMLRSQETALAAGFVDLSEYEMLNEVDTKIPHTELRQLIANRRHARVALEAAGVILSSPPKEQVWITHGLVIAALCEVLGVSDSYEHFIPTFCEIRELPISL